MSILLLKVSFFIVILECEVLRAIVFRLVKSTDEFRCSFEITPE